MTISDELAAALEAMRQEAGLPSIDAVAEVLLVDAIAAADGNDLCLSTEALSALILEAETSGPAEPWDARAVREEVLRRYAARGGK